jgi:hypothetical protein
VKQAKPSSPNSETQNEISETRTKDYERDLTAKEIQLILDILPAVVINDSENKTVLKRLVKKLNRLQAENQVSRLVARRGRPVKKMTLEEALGGWKGNAARGSRDT